MKTLLEAHSISVVRGGRALLQPLSFTLQEAEFIAIAGPNGSGKSTLLRALAGIWPVASGEVRLCGKPIHGYDRREIARMVSYVPQDTRMDFGFTVREIVAMGRHPHIGRFAAESRHDREAIEHGLALCDISHLRERSVNTLSGGERQRVLIARCLAAEPRCILLDEPTASLDLEHALDIFALASRLASQGCTIALATHDLNSGLRFARSVVLLNQGGVAHVGPADHSLDPAILESVFGIRAERSVDADGAPHYRFYRKERTA